MHGIVRHVEVERHAILYGAGHLFLCPESQRVGQEDVVLEEFLQAGDCPRACTSVEAVSVPTVVAAGLTYRTAGHIDIKAKSQRVLALTSEGSEMGLAHVYRAVARIREQARQSIVGTVQALPVPVGRTVGIAVVGLGVYPVGDSVTGGVLAGEQAGAGRRADALGIELGEAYTLVGQPLHIRRAVPAVERMLHRLPLRVGQKGHRSIHKSHVIHEENYDIGPLLSGLSGTAAGDQSQCRRGYRNSRHDFHILYFHTFNVLMSKLLSL